MLPLQPRMRYILLVIWHHVQHSCHTLLLQKLGHSHSHTGHSRHNKSRAGTENACNLGLCRLAQARGVYTHLVDEGSLELRVASVQASSRLHEADKQVQGRFPHNAMQVAT